MNPAVSKVAAIVCVVLAIAAGDSRADGAAAAATTTTAPATQSTAAANAPATPQPRIAVRDLLAWGTDQNFWCVDVIPLISGKQTVEKSYFRHRGPGDTQWRKV